MVAFLVFLAMMIVCIIGGVWISMYLYRPNGTAYLSEHQIVTLSQEAFVAGRSYKPRKMKADMGMGECARRVSGVSVAVLTMMLFLIVMFLNAGH